MALNLLLSGEESTDRKQIILTDVTDNWGLDGNADFSDILYAEMYVGIKGALYGPVILTPIFTAAGSQEDLVFVITPKLLGLDDELFEDALQEYHYGVSMSANPVIIERNVWPLESTYNLPLLNSTNKIPFEVIGSKAVRSYNLSADITLQATDESINPRSTLIISYQDGTTEQSEQSHSKDGVSQSVSITINVDRAKEIKSVSGNLFDEDRSVAAGRVGTAVGVVLNEQDLDLYSNVLAGLASEKTKAMLDREFISLRKNLLAGSVHFDLHEQLIMRHLAFNSVTNGAKEGLAENAEEIIDYLNEQY